MTITNQTYIIFEHREDNNKSFNKLRNFLDKLGLYEESVDKGIQPGQKPKFVWYRYINSFDKKILETYFYQIDIYLTNLIPKVDCITNKYKLYDNMKNIFPNDYLNLMSESFQLTKDTKYEKDTVFITRPVNMLHTGCPASSGEGIIVYDSKKTLEEAKKNLDIYDIVVSSKYINNPLLFKNKKFHLRCHMFLTIINNKLSGHIFDTYKIMVAKESYVDNDYQNKRIHDTHHDGLNDEDYLFPLNFTKDNVEYKNFNDSVIKTIYAQIRNISKNITIIASKSVKLQSNVKNSFHLIGCDFLIDSNLRVILLECNRFCDISDKCDGNYKIFLDRLWDWVNDIILKPAFLNDNRCDKDAVYILNNFNSH